VFTIAFWSVVYAQLQIRTLSTSLAIGVNVLSPGNFDTLQLIRVKHRTDRFGTLIGDRPYVHFVNGKARHFITLRAS